MKPNNLSVLLIFFVLLSCDKTSIPSSPTDEVTIQRFKVAHGESLSDKLKEKGLSQRYSCSVNTLNREGSTKEFSNMTAVHFFSNEVESAARGQKVRYLFVFTGESDSRNSWSLDSFNNVVRLAVCDLPDVPGIEQEMKKRLSDFGTDSWVMSSQRRPEFNFNAQKMDISDISPIKYDAEMPQIANSCEGWYCDSYFWTFVHVNGELVSITIECTSWDYEDLCGGGGGVPDPFVQNGGEPGDGDSNYDPCDPIGPPMKIPPFECLDACNWIYPTSEWYCGEPCSTGNPLIDNFQVQQGLTELWQASNTDSPIGQRREQGGWIISTSGGGYEVVPWPSSWTTFPCGIAMPSNWYESAPSNTVGIVHSHPFFAGDDTSSPTVCGEDGTENYTSGTNLDDISALADLATYLSDFSIKGYIIDGNNLVLYSPFASVDIIERCGY